MEIEDEKSIDSFQAEMNLELLGEEENTISQKERLNKMLEKLKAQNEENKEESQQNQEENPQELRAGNPNILRAVAPKKTGQTEAKMDPFVPNFKLNERYFYQDIDLNEWKDITNFIEKFISDEILNEKDLEEFFNNHPKIAKGNISKLQGSVAEIFAKKKDLKKYKMLTNFLIKKYYKPKPVICECYFFPNPSNEQRVVNMFRTCKKTLDIAIFTFTRDSIAKAILEALQRGVKVRCIGDDGNSKVKGSDVRLLASFGIPCKTDNNFRFHMHNKMAIIDNSVVITGSFNWTNQAINKNQDNILFIEDKKIANQYTDYFNKIWDSFDTVITKEDAIKYMEEEKKEQEKKDSEKQKNEKQTEKETTKKETTKKETAKKETTKKEATKKETTKNEKQTEKETTKKETTKKATAKKETTKKEATKKQAGKKGKDKKDSTKETTKKEKASTSKEKTTTKKKTEPKETITKGKETKTKKETAKSVSSTEGKENTKKEKSKRKETKEKRSKTMKETKKSSIVKSKEKSSSKKKTTKEKSKTTKEKKKEKVEKMKTKVTKRVRGVKSEPKKTQRKKK